MGLLDGEAEAAATASSAIAVLTRAECGVVGESGGDESELGYSVCRKSMAVPPSPAADAPAALAFGDDDSADDEEDDAGEDEDDEDDDGAESRV